KMKLGRAVGHERHIARIALILDALPRHRGFRLHVEHLAIKGVHRGYVGADEIEVMEFEFHWMAPVVPARSSARKRGPRATKKEELDSRFRGNERSITLDPASNRRTARPPSAHAE